MEQFTKKDIKHKTRKREVVDPRFIAAYIIRFKTDLTLKRAAKLLGYKDHTMVWYASVSVKKLIEVDKDFMEKYEQLINSFK